MIGVVGLVTAGSQQNLPLTLPHPFRRACGLSCIFYWVEQWPGFYFTRDNHNPLGPCPFFRSIGGSAVKTEIAERPSWELRIMGGAHL